MRPRGAVAERLGRGLQSLVQRFESARRLGSRRRKSSGATVSTGANPYYYPSTTEARPFVVEGG